MLKIILELHNVSNETSSFLKWNEPSYLTRTVFVQSGAGRSIVIESLRSFRPLYLLPSALTLPTSREPHEPRNSFYSYLARPFFPPMYIPFDLATGPTWFYSLASTACSFFFFFSTAVTDGRLVRPWMQPRSHGARLQNSRKEQKGECAKGSPRL